MSARYYRIVYAGYSVGSIADNANLHMPYDYNETSRQIDLSFTAIIYGQDRTELASKQAAIETAFSTRFGRLELQRFGQTDSYDQSENTGYNVLAQCKELDDPNFTGLLRAYSCSLVVQKPVNDSSEPGQEGLIDLAVSISEIGSRQRIIGVSGSYNALPADVGSGGAIERLQANIDALLDAEESSIDPDAVFERGGLSLQPDRFNKVVQFSISSAELVDRQSKALADDPDIRNHSLTVKTVRENNGFSYLQTSPLQEAGATFRCFVDKTRTTDLLAVWTTKIYPLLLEEISEHLGGGRIVAVGRQEPVFSTGDNSISINLIVLFRQSSTIVQSFESYSIRERKGIKLEYVADRTSAFAADLVPTNAEAQRQVVRSLVVDGDETEARKRLAEMKKASKIPPSGKRSDLKTGKGRGDYVGKGRPLRPSEVPDFGARGGYWIDIELQEPQVSEITIGTGQTTRLTQITQVTNGLYFVPAKTSGVAGSSAATTGEIKSIVDDL